MAMGLRGRSRTACPRHERWLPSRRQILSGRRPTDIEDAYNVMRAAAMKPPGQRRPSLELLLPLAQAYRVRSTTSSEPKRSATLGSF